MPTHTPALGTAAALSLDGWIEVTQFLAVRDVQRLGRACRAAHDVVSDNSVWEWLIVRDFPDRRDRAAPRLASAAPGSMQRAYYNLALGPDISAVARLADVAGSPLAQLGIIFHRLPRKHTTKRGGEWSLRGLPALCGAAVRRPRTMLAKFAVLAMDSLPETAIAAEEFFTSASMGPRRLGEISNHIAEDDDPRHVRHRCRRAVHRATRERTLTEQRLDTQRRSAWDADLEARCSVGVELLKGVDIAVRRLRQAVFTAVAVGVVTAVPAFVMNFPLVTRFVAAVYTAVVGALPGVWVPPDRDTPDAMLAWLAGATTAVTTQQSSATDHPSLLTASYVLLLLLAALDAARATCLSKQRQAHRRALLPWAITTCSVLLSAGIATWLVFTVPQLFVALEAFRLLPATVLVAMATPAGWSVWSENGDHGMQFLGLVFIAFCWAVAAFATDLAAWHYSIVGIPTSALFHVLHDVTGWAAFAVHPSPYDAAAFTCLVAAFGYTLWEQGSTWRATHATSNGYQRLHVPALFPTERLPVVAAAFLAALWALVLKVHGVGPVGVGAFAVAAAVVSRVTVWAVCSLCGGRR